MNYVCGFMFSEDKSKVALIRKQKPNWQKGKLNGVGGKIDRDENEMDTMIREFEEETGYSTNRLQWRRLVKLIGWNGSEEWKVYFFYTFDNNIEKLKTVEDEKIEIHNTIDLYKLDVIPNLLWLIPMALTESTRYSTIYSS